MIYIGVDGHVHSDELKHWKYIKKIKSGSGWRYFYTPEEIRAYYKEKIDKENKIKEKVIIEKKTRWSPQDAYSQQRRLEEQRYREAKKPSIKNIKKEAKDTWRYAKPQKPSTMMKKIQADSKKEDDRWINERERIMRSNTKLYKDNKDFDYGVARQAARNRVAWDENEKQHKENKKRNSDRYYNAKRYKEITKKSLGIVSTSKNKVSKGKAKVEKLLAPTSGGTQKSKTIRQTIGKPGSINKRGSTKPRVTKTQNGTLTSRTLKETVNGRTTIDRPYIPSEKEKKYIKKYQKRARKDSSAGTYRSKNLKTTIK